MYSTVDSAKLTQEVLDRALIGSALLKRIITFCRLLRAVGIEVTISRMLDFCRSLQFIDPTRREDFYHAARANLLSSQEDMELFQQVFFLFWRNKDDLPADDLCEGASTPEEMLEQEIRQLTGGEAWDSAEKWIRKENDLPQETPVPSYSPDEIFTHKDFGTLQEEEVVLMQKVIAQVARKLATVLSRRYSMQMSGPYPDLRRTWRRSLRHGGEIIDLATKQRKIKKAKLVLLCDVSGSMDYYSRFLLHFIYGMQRELRGIETLVFSTRLTRITNLLRRRGLDEGLRELARRVHDWSGGTNIGACLHTFNHQLARKLIGPKTITLIMSDGWDRGDPQVLSEEMARLSRQSYRLIWLNPLLGSPNYQPICQGMQAALPYMDYFLPVHNLESLIALGKMLRPLWN